MAIFSVCPSERLHHPARGAHVSAGAERPRPLDESVDDVKAEVPRRLVELWPPGQRHPPNGGDF